MICFYINAIPAFAKILTEHDKCCEWMGVEVEADMKVGECKGKRKSPADLPTPIPTITQTTTY